MRYVLRRTSGANRQILLLERGSSYENSSILIMWREMEEEEDTDFQCNWMMSRVSSEWCDNVLKLEVNTLLRSEYRTDRAFIRPRDMIAFVHVLKS